MLNQRIGRDFGRFSAHLDVLNLLDSNDHDIDYYYASRLPDEPAGGIDDIHFHVFNPRSVRLSIGTAF